MLVGPTGSGKTKVSQLFLCAQSDKEKEMRVIKCGKLFSKLGWKGCEDNVDDWGNNWSVTQY